VGIEDIGKMWSGFEGLRDTKGLMQQGKADS
jgi:hypothetical protein